MTLKEMRKRRGVKQLNAAQHLGMSRQRYARYEEAPWKMAIGYALSICEFLHCDPDGISDFYLPSDVEKVNIPEEQ